jgi:pimeloyl-ACP methyl ester carboxylesterase
MTGTGLAAACLVLAVSWLPVSAAADAGTGQAAGTGGAEIVVAVPYVTNRLAGTAGAEQRLPGGQRGPVGLGHCRVVFSSIPVIDRIAPRVPFYLADETRELSIAPRTDAQAFWAEVEAEAANTDSRSIVVFVHGYNYGFERNCTAAAELQRALAGKASVLMFSWPSNGRATDYVPDQADVEWSVPLLAQLLADLAGRLGSERVQVLAHSLGSRGVIFALERLRAEGKSRPLIGQRVLMAPDFDAEVFVERLPVLLPLAAGITLYASSNDTPLKASRQLHQAPRLGEAGEFLTVAPGMQTVDVSPLGRYQVMGHEYFRFDPAAAADLAGLLGEGRRAAERSGLRPLRRDDLVYWELVGDRARGDAGDDSRGKAE